MYVKCINKDCNKKQTCSRAYPTILKHFLNKEEQNSCLCLSYEKIIKNSIKKGKSTFWNIYHNERKFPAVCTAKVVEVKLKNG
jgi:hypothetical protein